MRDDIKAIIEANKVLQAGGINTRAKLSEYTLIERLKARAILRAQELVEMYPQAVTVQEVIELGKRGNYFTSEDDLLSVWGRVCRLLPQGEALNL